ncbi:D-3-phosphoglycerate dehydrogenase [Thioalkalivibrio nitratireducens DSM 14787]|uniref:D-3-phosphoglycerate dehydrogenase n=2 Tax=Thioalkalivibrio nitratireducens TaxID=186931 RepID=L0DWQ5_THIND|nr:D-3-phosphoglycerate dehydrogenase [Thioalkalivibrio nitratireducens DSM 14787]
MPERGENMYRIQTFNNIAIRGLERYPRETYEVASSLPDPDAFMLRSHNLHETPIPDSVVAVGRAGSGVNNIPVDLLSERGVAVFNAPGANANAVKELVIGGLLLAARNLIPAAEYLRGLDGDLPDFEKRVEDGKKRFVGFELPGRTLGVIGLGAIGVKIANAARGLGMHVIGYDPKITVESAWRLASDVERARSVDAVVSQADVITFHVPLNDQTRNILDATRIRSLKPGAIVINLARDGIVDDTALGAALDAGRVHAYVSDFPTPALIRHPRVITLPHLGASTVESEENCAVMIADQLRDYLEHGNVVNSVNLPALSLERKGDSRLAIVNRNLPDRVGQISHVLGQNGVNIVHLVNESRGNLAYTLLDVEGAVDAATAEAIAGIDGVLRFRIL